MEYWNDLITEKSWKILQEIGGKFHFILIGGWANYLWTKKFKSKDIDIVVEFKTLEKLKLEYDLRKNDKLKKYEIKINEIDIDIYVTFYSNLAIPLEKLRKTKIENFDVVKIEDLLILKQGAEISRGESEKGEKDRLDILSLLFYCEVDFKDYLKRLGELKKKEFHEKLTKIIKDFQEYKYFNMAPREFKIKKKGLLEKLRKTI